MSQLISGTFTAPGISDEVVVPSRRDFPPEGLVYAGSLSFSSTGTVDLERRIDGVTFRGVQTFTEADAANGGVEVLIDLVGGETFRWRCRAVSGTVGFALGKPAG